MDYTGHGILQARIAEWVAMPSSRGSSQPRIESQVSRIAGGLFSSWATREALSEVSQPQEDKCCAVPRISGPQSSQIDGDRKWRGGCQGLGGLEDGELFFNGYSFARCTTPLQMQVVTGAPT